MKVLRFPVITFDITRKTIIVALFAVAVALITWQQVRLARLENHYRTALASSERERSLRQDLEQQLRDSAPSDSRADTVARLTAENARLRNEATTARRAVQRADTITSAPPAATASATNFPVPVLSFSAQSSAEMRPGETIVTGGWPGENGARSFMFLTYQPTSKAEALAFTASIYDISGEQATALGLAGFRADADGNTPSALLDLNPDTKAHWLSSLKTAEGVRLTSSPSLTTMVGREATIFIGQQVPVGYGKYADVGRTIALLPVQGENGIKVSVKTSLTTVPTAP